MIDHERARAREGFAVSPDLWSQARLAVRIGEDGDWLLIDPAQLSGDIAEQDVRRWLERAPRADGPLIRAAHVPVRRPALAPEPRRLRAKPVTYVDLAPAGAPEILTAGGGVWRGAFPHSLGDAARLASSAILPLAHAGRARAQAALRNLQDTLGRQNRFQNAVFDNMAEGVIMLDEHGDVALWNHAAEAILCMPAPDLGYRQWLSHVSVFSPDELTPVPADRTPLARALRGQAVNDVHVLVRHDGLPQGVWVSVNARPLGDASGQRRGAVAVFRDVTEERAARQAMERAQQDVRRVIESSPEGIAIVRDERWIFCNRAMARALGHASPQALVGRHGAEIAHPDDWPRVASRMSELLCGSGEPGAAEYEVRYRRAGGDYAWMEIELAQLTEFEGAPAVLVMARDITERKRLQAQLRVSERLVSVGTLAAGVAHEINSPLAAVLGNVEWVAGKLERLLAEHAQPGYGPGDAGALHDELRRLLEPVREAKEAAERVREIVRDLKLFSRAEEELRGPVDLTRVLDSASRLAWHEVRHRGRLIKDYRDLPPAFGNEARLGQVFLNLLINAAQAIPEGHADRHEIRLTARVEGGVVRVEVRDTGVGIAPEIIPRIFDPFFTTKPPGVGTGLGLSICHRIVADYGGQIDVESEPGAGSAFCVTLRVADRRDAPSAAKAQEPASPRRRGRVLVLDDDPAIGSTLRLILSEWHEVTLHTDGRAALRELAQGARYDVILCDVMMPQMTAMDFHAALYALQPETAEAIVFLTGGAFTVRAREFLDRVPNTRFDKPFDMQQLVALVHERIAASRRPSAIPSQEPSPSPDP